MIITLLAERRGFLTPAEANGRLERLMRGQVPAPVCVACGVYDGAGPEGYCLACALARLNDGWQPCQAQEG
jgi:hypothetical protein